MGTPLLGTVIAAEITTGNTANTFSIGDTNLMQGGHHSVATIEERDAITGERRRAGMTCWVSGTLNAMFQLIDGTANSDWVVTQQGTLSLLAEVGTRSESDQFLQNQITYEAGTRASSDQSIITSLSNEAGSRIASDLAEQGTRSSADQNLQNQISTANFAEQGTRSEADQFLQNQITAEAGSLSTANFAEQGTRSSADQNLQNQITAEALARASADQVILNVASAGTSVAYSAYALASLGTIAPPLSSLPDVNIPAPSANQVLAFDGSQWIASDAPSQVAPGSFTYFLDDTSSGTLAYSNLVNTPSGVPEDIDTVSVGGANPFVADEGYISTYLNRTRIDAGIWEFNTYASVSSAADPANIVIEIYTAALNGVETLLFSGTSPQVSSLSPTLVTHIVTSGSRLIDLNDKLVAKYYGLRNSAPSVNLSIYHSGSEHDSHFHTPLALAHNDLGGLQGGSSSANQFYHTTLDQNNALTGTSGLPSNSNKYVTDQDLTGRILVEQGTRSSADQNLQNNIVIEQGTRSERDQYLLNLIGSSTTAEQGTRSSADQSILNLLNSSIVVEQGTRSEADQSILNLLSSSIFAEQGTRSSADQSILNLLNSSIVVEQGTRSEEDQFLQNQIYTEQGTRSEADQSILNLISSMPSLSGEQGTRSEADQFLQNQITAEAGTRAAADSALSVEIQTVENTLASVFGNVFSGTFNLYTSQIPKGKADTKINVINGVIIGFTPSYMPWEDFETYPVGDAGTLPDGMNGGSAWSSNGSINTLTMMGTYGLDSMEDYPVTSPTGYSGSSYGTLSLDSGYRWSANGTAFINYIGMLAEDTLESYATGTILGSQGTGGYGWGSSFTFATY